MCKQCSDVLNIPIDSSCGAVVYNQRGPCAYRLVPLQLAPSKTGERVVAFGPKGKTGHTGVTIGTFGRVADLVYDHLEASVILDSEDGVADTRKRVPVKYLVVCHIQVGAGV